MASARMRGNKTFWQRKNEAFRNFGKAESRPQENFRKYLLNKRQLNLGLREVLRGTENLDEINGFYCDVSALQPPLLFIPNPLPYSIDSWKFVQSESDFEECMAHIVAAKEFTLDLEENMDHSYNGKNKNCGILTN